MRVLIVGAGATGGYFGARLAAAGRDVTFLVRPGRAAVLRERGLVITSPHGDLTIQPRLLETGAAAGPFDLILVALKAYALEGALGDLAGLVGPETMLVPFLNGMRHLDALIERFGERPVLGGVCLVATTLRPDGSIAQLAPFNEVVWGERDGSMSERVRAVDAVMQDAGFTARMSTEIMQEMWNKWMLLASGGALTCLMRGNAGEIEAVPGGGGGGASVDRRGDGGGGGRRVMRRVRRRRIACVRNADDSGVNVRDLDVSGSERGGGGGGGADLGRSGGAGGGVRAGHPSVGRGGGAAADLSGADHVSATALTCA